MVLKTICSGSWAVGSIATAYLAFDILQSKMPARFAELK
jgi:hypothetical protein